jgi:hypothetical protein
VVVGVDDVEVVEGCFEEDDDEPEEEDDDDDPDEDDDEPLDDGDDDDEVDALEPVELPEETGTEAAALVSSGVAAAAAALVADAGGANGSWRLRLERLITTTLLSVVLSSLRPLAGTWPGVATGVAAGIGVSSGADFMNITGAPMATIRATSGIGHRRRRTTSSTRLRSIMTLQELRASRPWRRPVVVVSGLGPRCTRFRRPRP